MQIVSEMLETISEELSEPTGEMDPGLIKADSYAEGQSSPDSCAGLPSDHDRCIQVRWRSRAVRTEHSDVHVAHRVILGSATQAQGTSSRVVQLLDLQCLSMPISGGPCLCWILQTPRWRCTFLHSPHTPYAEKPDDFQLSSSGLNIRYIVSDMISPPDVRRSSLCL